MIKKLLISFLMVSFIFEYIKKCKIDFTFFQQFKALLQPEILMCPVDPDGKVPVRKTDGAIGYDAFVRHIVSGKEMCKKRPYLRKTLFDFKNEPDSSISNNCMTENDETTGGKKMFYRLYAGQSVLVSLGFFTAMEFPLLYWVAPRSGLAAKMISITNAPGTVDPDYRGEAGALIENRNKDGYFDIYADMRICQIIFMWAVIPQFNILKKHNQLPKSMRGAGGFGSTGEFK